MSVDRVCIDRVCTDRVSLKKAVAALMVVMAVMSKSVVVGGIISNACAVEDFSQRIYQIELYIFAHKAFDDQPAGSNKAAFWPKKTIDIAVESIQAERSIALPSGSEYFENFAMVSNDELKSPQILNGLGSSRRHRLLYHAAWQQQVLTQSNAIPIKIEGGELFGDEHYELFGSLTFHISRYLHLSSDLYLNEWQYNDEAVRWQILQQYGLQGSLRMRSGEVHYLDHPAFGLAVIIHRT